MLRPKKPTGGAPHIALEPIFKGEHVEGLSGPYRALFSDISKELQPDKLELNVNENLLDLLHPCANQRDNEQVGKDRFVLSSSTLNTRKLQHFEFLGVLMGICIRTGVNLVIDLPQITWKQLVSQKPRHAKLEWEIGCVSRKEESGH